MESVYCPECGNVVALKMLAVHRNRMHQIPLPTAPPRAPDQPDLSVPNWVSDAAVPPKPAEKPPQPEPPAPEEPADTTVEIPEHEHEDYRGDLEEHESELTTLKLAIAHLDQKLKERESEITVLQGMLTEMVKKEEENEMATATPIIIYDTQEKRVVGMNLLYRKKGQQVEGILKKLVDGWHKESKGVEFNGLPPNMTLRLKEDPEERGFEMVPATMLVLRLSRKEREALGPVMQLPPGAETPPEQSPPDPAA